MQENSHYRQLNAACCKFEKSQKIISVAKELMCLHRNAISKQFNIAQFNQPTKIA